MCTRPQQHLCTTSKTWPNFPGCDRPLCGTHAPERRASGRGLHAAVVCAVSGGPHHTGGISGPREPRIQAAWGFMGAGTQTGIRAALTPPPARPPARPRWRWETLREGARIHHTAATSTRPPSLPPSDPINGNHGKDCSIDWPLPRPCMDVGGWPSGRPRLADMARRATAPPRLHYQCPSQIASRPIPLEGPLTG